jgi:hypothetical protein
LDPVLHSDSAADATFAGIIRPFPDLQQPVK